MKNTLFLILLAATLGIQTACSKRTEAAAPPESIQLSIKGMTCESCVNGITTAVNNLPGVQSCEVSLEQESATVSFQPKSLTPEQIRDRINKLGFEATLSGPKPSVDSSL
jgi:Cu+-exporting ATPase